MWTWKSTIFNLKGAKRSIVKSTTTFLTALMKMIWISLPVFCRYKYNKNKPSWLYPFASKMANYSRHSEIWNFRKNSKSTSFSSITAIFPFSNFFQSLNVPPKIDQFGRKKCQKKRKNFSYHFKEYFLLKAFFMF